MHTLALSIENTWETHRGALNGVGLAREQGRARKAHLPGFSRGQDGFATQKTKECYEQGLPLSTFLISFEFT